MVYVYDNLKRKWKERQQTELIGANIITSAIGNKSERKIQMGIIPIAVTEQETIEIKSRDLHDTEKYKESLTQNFERINKEIQKIVTKMNFNERKLENIELSIADMKKTHHVNKC